MANALDIEKFYKSFPTISHKRNRFPFETGSNFNMKMGEITPLLKVRVVPGQTYNLDLSTVLKVAPMQVPPMDDAVFKVFAFYQADRNTWDNYPYWIGEKQNPENPEEEPTYVVPKVTLPKGGFPYNSFYDNIGCRPAVGNYKIDAFLPRADRQIYNTYFRNQSLENPLPVSTGDEDDDPNENMNLRKICRPRDFFAQALPTMSGTTPVEIPLGSVAPVIPRKTKDGRHPATYIVIPEDGQGYDETGTRALLRNNNNQPIYTTQPDTGFGTNLIADLSNAVGAPLEGLYQAIAYNTYDYIKSRGGSRYFEIISNIYGVVNPDQVLRLPEFLGSSTQYIDFDTITQTNEGTENSGLGHRAANGYMEDYTNLINKSFGEFGWIIIYGVVTYMPKYQQGVTRLMKTEDPLDLFNPIFNLMGDEAIYEDEIYQQDDDVVDENGNKINDRVWGYGKRNSRLLYPVQEIHGEQRSEYEQSLDVYHFAENYPEAPNLNKEWDKISDEGFKRSLQIQDETQFIGNCLLTGTQDIEIPLNAIPSPIPSQIIEHMQ